MTILGLDHLVLTVASIDRTCEFYERVLGMRRETFAGGRSALKFGTQKINLHEAGKELDPHALHATPGSGDLCFIVDDLAAAQARLDAEGVVVIEGPAARTGAIGAMMSIYCRDPDGNLIELSQYR
ncbi:MAG: VOC family protein [Proteobacteria bacterium]|nr:VOC family protein [Pseudomonadota bacterium]